jgi:hypothetical protein
VRPRDVSPGPRRRYAGRVRGAFLIAGLALACTLRGDGERASETRILEFFNVVEVFDTFVAQLVVDPSLPLGDDLDVVVSGDANALERLFLGVHEVDTLSVGVDPNHLTKLALPPEVELRLPVLVKLHAANASRVDVTGGTGEIEIESHDDAAVVLQSATLAALMVSASDDSVVTLAGDGPSLKISTTGAARVEAQGFRAASVTVDAQGSGAVVVCSTGDLTVEGPGEAMVEARCN